MFSNYFFKVKSTLIKIIKLLFIALLCFIFVLMNCFIVVWNFFKMICLLVFSKNIYGEYFMINTHHKYSLKKKISYCYLYIQFIIWNKGWHLFLWIFSILVYYNFVSKNIVMFFSKNFPIIKLVCKQILIFFISKHKKWMFYLTQQSLLLRYFNLSLTSSFILYLYVASILISFLVFFCICLIHLYIYSLILSFIFLISYILLRNFSYIMLLWKNKLSFFVLEIACDFIILLNKYLEYLNTNLTRIIIQTDTLNAYKEQRFWKNSFFKSILLFILSSNASKLHVNFDHYFLSPFFQKKKNNKLNESEEIPGLLSVFFKKSIETHTLTKTSNDLTNSFVNVVTKSYYPKYQDKIMFFLLNSYTKTLDYNFILRLRNVMKNTKYPGNNLEFKKLWSFFYNKGTPLRLLDMLQGTFWLQNSEDSLVDARYTEEAKYAYHKRHGRPVKLIYHYFKENLLPSNMWSFFFSFIKKERKLTQNVMDVSHLEEKFTSKSTVKLYRRSKHKKEWSKDLLASKDENIYTIFLDLFASKMPLFLSFFSYLNYMLLLLFGELFGSIFENNLNKAFNLYKIQESLEKTNQLNWKWLWIAKTFWFLVYDGWILGFKFLYTSFVSLQTNLFKDTLSIFVFSKCILLLLFVTQYFSIDGKKSIYFFFTLKFQDFLKFNFEKATLTKKPWLKNWGWPGVFFEQIAFFFFFFLLLFLDLLLVFYYVLLRFKWFYYCITSAKEFLRYLFCASLACVFLPIYDFWRLCEDIYNFNIKNSDLKQKKGSYTHAYMHMSVLQKNFVQIKFFIMLLRKYWWDIVIEEEQGLKRIPFFYKYSKKFIWFDKFLGTLNDVLFLVSYYVSVFKKRFMLFYFFIKNENIWLSLSIYKLIYFKYLLYFIFIWCLEIYLFFYKIFFTPKKKIPYLHLQKYLLNTFYLKKNIQKKSDKFSFFYKNFNGLWNTYVSCSLNYQCKSENPKNISTTNAQDILKSLYDIQGHQLNSTVENLKFKKLIRVKTEFLYQLFDKFKLSQDNKNSLVINHKDLTNLISFNFKTHNPFSWKTLSTVKINSFYRYASLKHQSLFFHNELIRFRFNSLDRAYFSIFTALFRKKLLISKIKLKNQYLFENEKKSLFIDFFNKKYSLVQHNVNNIESENIFVNFWSLKNKKILNSSYHGSGCFIQPWWKLKLTKLLYVNNNNWKNWSEKKNYDNRTSFEEVSFCEFTQNVFLNSCIYFFFKLYNSCNAEQLYFSYLLDFIKVKKIFLSKSVWEFRSSFFKNISSWWKTSSEKDVSANVLDKNKSVLLVEYLGFLNFSVLNFMFDKPIIKTYFFDILFAFMQFWLQNVGILYNNNILVINKMSAIYKHMKMLYIFGFNVVFSKKIKNISNTTMEFPSGAFFITNNNELKLYTDRYRKYLEVDFNIEFRDALTALKLRRALISDTELLWGDIFKIKFFQKRMSSKNPFNFSGNLLNRTHNLLNHNLKWIWFMSWWDISSKHKQPIDYTFADYSCIIPEEQETFTKNSIENSFYFFDMLFFIYQFYRIKLGLTWFLFRFKYFFIKYRWDHYMIILLGFFFFIMFGFSFFFSINFWVLFSSWFFSVFWFIKIWVCWFVVNIFVFLDLSLGNLIRESFEFVFYYKILQTPFMEQLVALNLYDVFLYCLNHLALFEENGLNLPRIMWIIYASVIVKLGCFYYDFISWCFLLLFFFKKVCLMWGLSLEFIIIYNTIIDIVVLEVIEWFYYFGLSCFWTIVCFTEYGLDFFWIILILFSHFCCETYIIMYNQILYFCDIFFFFKMNIIIPFEIISSQFYTTKQYYFDWWWFVNTFLSYYVYIKVLFPMGFSCFTHLLDSWYTTGHTFAQMVFDLFAFCFWSFVLCVIIFMEFFVSSINFIFYSLSVVKILFFKYWLNIEILVYILQLIGWFYLNVFYYAVIIPFISILFYFCIILKYCIYLPYYGFVCIIKMTSFIFILCFDIVNLVFLLLTKIIWFLDLFFIKLLYIPLVKILTTCMYESLAYLNIPYIFWSTCKFVFSCFFSFFLFLCAPIFSLVYYFFNFFFYSFYPFFFFYAHIYTILLFFFKYWSYFFLIFKEVLLLYFFLWGKFFSFFYSFFNGLVVLFITFGEIFDELFPNIKNIFDPLGGLSIFYATIYYYIFIWFAVLWNRSFRLFNDTMREPPVPDQVWIKTSHLVESHPVVQRLPFDVYRLLYSERLVSDIDLLPLELKQSMEVWTPSSEKVSFSVTRIKETPLNMQGYYYMMLNSLVRDQVSLYFKNKHSIGIRFQQILGNFRPKRYIGWQKMSYALWEAYCHFYLSLITEEDELEYMEAVDMRRPGTRLERMLRLSEFLAQLELFFDDHTRRLRALSYQQERQLLYDTFGKGQADEIIWSFPILGYWFGNKKKTSIDEQYKLIVFRARLHRGIKTINSNSNNEAKTRFLLQWFAANKIDSLSMERIETEDCFLDDSQNKQSIINRHRRLLSPEDDILIDPDDFIIRKYRKVSEFDTLDGDFSVDHFFIGVRVLDLFLYPILVFATVNTGWWYSSNGIMDSILKYTNLSEYADELAESFLLSIEQQKNLNINHKKIISSYDLTYLDIYNPDIIINEFLDQGDDETLDLFYETYPELYNYPLFETNPSYFLDSIFDFSKSSINGYNWLISLPILEQLGGNTYIHQGTDTHLSSEEVYSNLIRQRDINSFKSETNLNNKSSFWSLFPNTFNIDSFDFQEFVYLISPQFKDKYVYPTTTMVNELFNTEYELNKKRMDKFITSSFDTNHTEQTFQDLQNFDKNKNDNFLENFISLPGINNSNALTDINTLQSYLNVSEDTNLDEMNLSIDETHNKIETQWALLAEHKHPLDSVYSQRKLKMRYHTFPETVLSPQIWAPYYETVEDFLQKNLVMIDDPYNLQYNTDFIWPNLGITKHYISDIDDFVSKKFHFSSKILPAFSSYILPIHRQYNDLPDSKSLQIVAETQSSYLNYDAMKKVIDRYNYFWTDYMTMNKNVEIKNIADDFEYFVLFGDLIYEYYTTGFLSFTYKRSLQKLFLLFIQVYEDTLLGRFYKQILQQSVMRRYTVGIETAPFVVNTLDPSNYLIGKDPYFVMSDLKYLKAHFFNMYTNYSVYDSFNRIMLQRIALYFFLNPSAFNDIWYTNMAKNTFHIALDVIINHAQYASYYFPEIYHSEIMHHHFFVIRWFFLEKIKSIARVFWIFGFEITKTLQTLISVLFSFEFIKSVYYSVAYPFISFYDVTKYTWLYLCDIIIQTNNWLFYILIELNLFYKFNWICSFFFFNSVKTLSALVYSIGYEIICNFFFFFDKNLMLELGLNSWWKSSLIRGLLLEWPSLFFKSLFLEDFFNIPDELFEFFKWPLYLNEHHLFMIIIKMTEFYWEHFGTSLGFFLTLSSQSSFGLLHLYYLFQPHIIMFFFWELVALGAPSFWDLLVNKSVIFFLKKEAYIMRVFVGDKDIMGVDPFWYSESTEDILFTDILDCVTFGLQGSEEFLGLRKEIYEISDFIDINLSRNQMDFEQLKPKIYRENNEAPFSFMNDKGFILYTQQEIKQLSDKLMYPTQENKLFSSVDFLNLDKSYHYSNDLTRFAWWLEYQFPEDNIYNLYGVHTQPLPVKPTFYFLKDIGPDFYGNLRSYENELNIPKLRNFFLKYQLLIKHVWPYGKLPKEIPYSVIELENLYRLQGVISIKFKDNSYGKWYLNYKVRPFLRISCDVYGNIIYLYKYDIDVRRYKNKR